ncbi:hypothetical protein RFI_06238, partial [Reticulomyxa filosa]
MAKEHLEEELKTERMNAKQGLEESQRAINSLKARVRELERSLNQERSRTEEMDKDRRESISALHSNMFKQLLDATAEHEREKNDLVQQIRDLKSHIYELELQLPPIKSPTNLE